MCKQSPLVTIGFLSEGTLRLHFHWSQVLYFPHFIGPAFACYSSKSTTACQEFTMVQQPGFEPAFIRSLIQYPNPYTTGTPYQNEFSSTFMNPYHFTVWRYFIDAKHLIPPHLRRKGACATFLKRTMEIGPVRTSRRLSFLFGSLPHIIDIQQFEGTSPPGACSRRNSVIPFSIGELDKKWAPTGLFNLNLSTTHIASNF